MKRKLLSIVLALCLTLTLLPTMSVAAGSYADTNDHWAESSIERWSAYGIIQGSNGQFDPNGQLTCAQLATILAKLLKLPAAKDAGFSDNKADAWYYDAINRCAAAGILKGNGDGTVTPEAPITRERAMVMLARALGIEPLRNPDLTRYTDAAQVSAYARGYVAALIEAGIVGGVTADELAPQDNINRASTVTILDRAISTYVDEAGKTVKADGKGLVLVVAKNVKITGAPEGTKVVVADGATGLTVNGKSVSDDQTYIVPKTEPAKPSSSSSSGGHSHSHSYVYTDNGDGTHTATCYAGDATFTEQHRIVDGKCTLCGAAQTDKSVASVKKSDGSHAYYTTLAAAINAADAGDTVTLVNNAGTNSLKAGITYDLNGYKLTYTSSGSFSFSNQTTSFIGGAKGGTLDFPNILSTNSAICPNAGATLNVSDITVTCNGSAFYPAGNATALNITNCNVSSSVYCVGTNASSTDNYGVVITLKDSKFTSTASDGDCTAVIVNVACKLVIDNCELTAGRQGLIVRAGTATVTNSTIKTTGTYGEKDKYHAAPWKSGNEVPAAALTVGNYVAGDVKAYLADAIVTLENTKLIGENNFPALYVDGNTSYIGKVSISGDAAFVSGAMMKGQQTAEGKATISITGGTYSSDPTAYVAEGYKVTRLEDGKYQVVALFAGGTGTAEDPFLIATSEQFKAIDQLNGKPYCFKQTADIAVAAGDEVTKFAGVYDGGNQKLSSACTSGDFAFLFNVGGLSGHATFKNINVAMGELATSLLSCVDWGTSYGADFENLTFTSTSELTKANSNNFGFVVSNAIYTDNGEAATYNFEDITVNVNLQNTGTCTGVLIGSGPCFNVNTTMNFTNCTNNGTITGTNFVGFLYGNSAYIGSLDEFGTINVTTCTTNAVIKSTNDSADVAFAPGASKSTKAAALNASYQQADKYIVGNCLNGKTISVTQNAGADKFSIAIDDASGYTYKLVLNVAATYRTLDGEAWNDADVAKIPSKWDEAWNVSNGLKYLIALSKDTNITGTLNSFHAYDKRTAANKGIETNTLTYNEDGYAIVVKNGTNCVVFNTTEDTYIDSSVSILVYAYSGNTLVGTKVIK